MSKIERLQDLAATIASGMVHFHKNGVVVDPNEVADDSLSIAKAIIEKTSPPRYVRNPGNDTIWYDTKKPARAWLDTDNGGILYFDDGYDPNAQISAFIHHDRRGLASGRCRP